MSTRHGSMAACGRRRDPAGVVGQGTIASKVASAKDLHTFQSHVEMMCGAIKVHDGASCYELGVVVGRVNELDG